MCRGIWFLVILSLIPIWTFVALPIIYINGGPDRVSALLRSSMVFGNVANWISALVAVIAAAVAWEAIRRQTKADSVHNEA